MSTRRPARTAGAIGERHLDAGVAGILRFVPRIASLERGRARIVAAAPREHLGLAVFPGHVGLVQPLQRAVVALVQAPALFLRQPHLVELFEGDPQRANRPLQHRSERQIEAIAPRLEEAPGGARFLDALRGKIDVGPAGEAVFAVPVRLAMAQKNELVHGAEL
jgi:hypothetical protein